MVVLCAFLVVVKGKSGDRGCRGRVAALKERPLYQSFLMSKDHSNLRWVWLSSSTNFETAL